MGVSLINRLSDYDTEAFACLRYRPSCSRWRLVMEDTIRVKGYGDRLCTEGTSSITHFARRSAVVTRLATLILSHSYTKSSFIQTTERTLLSTSLAHFPHQSSYIDLGGDGRRVVQWRPPLAVPGERICAGSHQDAQRLQAAERRCMV